MHLRLASLRKVRQPRVLAWFNAASRELIQQVQQMLLNSFTKASRELGPSLARSMGDRPWPFDLAFRFEDLDAQHLLGYSCSRHS